MRFRERNQTLLGAGSLLGLVVLIALALNFRNLPVINSNETYTAEFANSGGLHVNDNVTIAGVRVGSVKDMQLRGDRVRVTFEVESGIDVGPESSAAAKVLALVGTEYLEITPAGDGKLRSAIPAERTTVPYTFVDTLQTLSSQEQEYDLPTLVESLQAGTELLSGTTTADTTSALTGLADLSKVLADRKAELATVVTEGAGLAQTLSDHRDQLFQLVGQGDVVLQVLQQRREALAQLFAGTTSLSQELSRVLGPNRDQLKALLSNLDTVSALLARNTANIDEALPLLSAFSTYAANATGSGAFVDSRIPTMLLPDNLLAQCAQPANAPVNPVVGCRP